MNFTIPKRPAVFTLKRALVSTGLFFAAASAVFGQVQPSQNQSRAFGPDACGPADPAYIHTANETGGIPMFLQRSEAAKEFHLVRESTRNNVSTVFWATGTLDGKPHTITIPVDSVTKRITFTFSVDTKGNHINLTQPSGGAITEGLAGIEDTELNCVRILTVTSPEAGLWDAELPGARRGWVQPPRRGGLFFAPSTLLAKAPPPPPTSLSTTHV